MQYQRLEKRQLLGVEHGSVSVLDDRIAGDAPPLVTDDAPTIFTSRLSVVPLAVIPTGCGIGEHCGTLRHELDQIPRGQLDSSVERHLVAAYWRGEGASILGVTIVTPKMGASILGVTIVCD
jgi:hypothetical protein